MWKRARLTMEERTGLLTVPLSAAVALALLSTSHQSFEEFDGVMQSLAGASMVAGEGHTGWASHFWPPLYALLLGVGGLVASPFVAGKVISVVAAAALLGVTYALVRELSGTHRAGLWAQAFVALTPLFAVSAIQVENHMLDALFFVSAMLVLIKAMRRPTWRLFMLAGLLAGLAGLTRYTSYVLLPGACVAALLVARPVRALALSSAFALSFSLVSMPWWVVNALHNGSPVHTWQYLNIGAAVDPGGASRWWWQTQAEHDGIVSIALTWPLAYATNVLRNVVISVTTLHTNTGALLALAVPLALGSRRLVGPRRWAFVWVVWLGFVALVSQAFVFDEVFLSWLVIVVAMASVTGERLLRWAAQRRRWWSRPHVHGGALAMLLIVASALTSVRLLRYLEGESSDAGQLVDAAQVSEALRTHDPQLADKTVMCVHPARALEVGSRWRDVPAWYPDGGAIEEYVAYAGLPSRVHENAARHPQPLSLGELGADYLVVDEALVALVPQFAELLHDPDSAQVPRSFRPIYASSRVVVYALE